MRFMTIMIAEVYRKPVPPDFMPDIEAVEKMGQSDAEIQKAGVLLALDGLTPPSAGARVSFAVGETKTVDGPFAEVKEAVGGYWMIQVKSCDEAIEWAKRCPGGPSDVIEIRQMHEPEEFWPEALRSRAQSANLSKSPPNRSWRLPPHRNMKMQRHDRFPPAKARGRFSFREPCRHVDRVSAA
jgi:hypothetical protein